MKRAVGVGGVVVVAMTLFASQAMPCGDKFLAGGANNPTFAQTQGGGAYGGVILLYRNPNSVAATNVLTPDLKKTLERSGHKVRLVETEAAFNAAIKDATYDVVSADMGDLDKVQVENGDKKTVVVPVVYNASWADVTKFKELHEFVLEGPNRAGALAKVVNQALAAAR